ncbi:hypothetical protein B0H34DRAFT_78640 [Crassisporium funariophilum]|nr:hypothetical protein B0H34DRAFT_78640 [Crassisporium funariophilum]
MRVRIEPRCSVLGPTRFLRTLGKRRLRRGWVCSLERTALFPIVTGQRFQASRLYRILRTRWTLPQATTPVLSAENRVGDRCAFYICNRQNALNVSKFEDLGRWRYLPFRLHQHSVVNDGLMTPRAVVQTKRFYTRDQQRLGFSSCRWSPTYKLMAMHLTSASCLWRISNPDKKTRIFTNKYKGNESRENVLQYASTMNPGFKVRVDAKTVRRCAMAIFVPADAERAIRGLSRHQTEVCTKIDLP